MAETTGIAWTRSTFNGWIGCAAVSPGCEHCYAEAWDKRFGGGKHWGTGAPRRLTSDANWAQPPTWNRAAAAAGEFWPVFCASLSDVFDNEVPQHWRDRLWALIRATPALTWQIVTKRIGNAKRMLPADWGDGYRNVWLLATVVNQDEANRDVEKLLETPAAVHGLSMEPLLGPVDLTNISTRDGSRLNALAGVMRPGAGVDDAANAGPERHLEWVIMGGESNQLAPAREFRIEWAQALVEQCVDARVATFVKQLGHHVTRDGLPLRFHGKAAEPSEWPRILRRQEFPLMPTSVRQAA